MRLDAAARQYFEDHGTFLIENGGAYLHGISYDYTKKLHVAYTYSAEKFRGVPCEGMWNVPICDVNIKNVE